MRKRRDVGARCLSFVDSEGTMSNAGRLKAKSRRAGERSGCCKAPGVREREDADPPRRQVPLFFWMMVRQTRVRRAAKFAGPSAIAAPVELELLGSM